MITLLRMITYITTATKYIRVYLMSLQSKQLELDCKLQSLMEIWIAKGSDKDADALTRAVLKAVLFVAEQLQQKAVFLGQARFSFKHASSQLSWTWRWGRVLLILFQVVSKSAYYLPHPYMSYKCVHRKFSIILYRKEGDILTSLSWALGNAQYSQA